MPLRSRKLTLCALLTTVALAVFVLEAQIPLPLPIPGLRLGLSNIVTLFALFFLGPKAAAAILLARVLLGNLFTGQIMALLYALSGGLLSYLAMVVSRRFLKTGQIWVAGVLSSLAHNIGQMAAAVAIAQTPALLLYLPALLLCGMVTGVFTGLCAQGLLRRFSKEKF